MEPNIWIRFVGFVKDSYTKRLRQASSGIIMGFIGGQHLLFSGQLANLVNVGWWILKGVGTVCLAFFSSLATSYGAYLFENRNKKKQIQHKKK